MTILRALLFAQKALYAGQSLQCKDRMAGLLRENDETNPSPWRFHLLACGTREARIASCIFFGCIHFAATNKVHVLGRQARSLRAINSEEIPAQSENIVFQKVPFWALACLCAPSRKLIKPPRVSPVFALSEFFVCSSLLHWQERALQYKMPL